MAILDIIHLKIFKFKLQQRTVTHIIVIQEHAELSHTNTEISFIELIGDVPAERSKLSSFLYDTMEKAQTKQ